MMANRSPSVSLALRAASERSPGFGSSAPAAGPSPLPSLPWQAKHTDMYSLLPLAIASASPAFGFVMALSSAETLARNSVSWVEKTAPASSAGDSSASSGVASGVASATGSGAGAGAGAGSSPPPQPTKRLAAAAVANNVRYGFQVISVSSSPPDVGFMRARA